MPALSLYSPEKTNNYRYIDRIVREQMRVGATDLYVHKYLGPSNAPSSDASQPQYNTVSPTNIQDLLFLENRDRIYEPDIIRLRGHYNVQNLDFDLSQFGLFLNNDIIFITVHYNDMIDLIGRKLMVGDVIELPHLLDYNPLDETIPVALKRFYQITDGNFASEGFSPTWYPHLWRIKCEPLSDIEQFAQILNEPVNTDNYLGTWDKEKTYPPGYVISYGDENYVAKKEVPANTAPPNEEYWEVDPNKSTRDVLSTFKKNLEINDALLEEAKRLVPLSGYDNTNLYVVPTYDEVYGKIADDPAPPININVLDANPIVITGSMTFMRSPNYKNPSPVVRISKESLSNLWDLTTDSTVDKIDKFISLNLQTQQLAPERNDTGSGEVSGSTVLLAQSMGPVSGPYGTSDNTFSTADQNPALRSFTGTVTQSMDYRADCDPRYQYIARSTPRTFGYSAGYLTGDGKAPNGSPTGAGIAFPQNPKVGDYFLRIDYMPQILFRWDGKMWVRISDNVRTGMYFESNDQTSRASFVNNTNQTQLTDGSTAPERQALSTALRIPYGNIPPRGTI